MKEHPFGPGSRVVIYETKNAWARVTKFISRDQIATQFPGQFLPETVAMWIPVKDLPEVASSSPAIKEALGEAVAKEAKKLEEEKRRLAFSFIPQNPAIPTQRANQSKQQPVEVTKANELSPLVKKVKVDDTDEFKKIIIPRKDNAANKVFSTVSKTIKIGHKAYPQAYKLAPIPEITEEKGIPVATAIEDDTETKEATPEIIQGEPAPNAPIPIRSVRAITQTQNPEVNDTEIKTAKLETTETETNVQEVTTQVNSSQDADNNTTDTQQAVAIEEVETDSFGNPIVSIPRELTNELKDERLAKLPIKPNTEVDLKALIAMRHHGLKLLESGECTEVVEGGKSLSLAGWVYLRCANDTTFRQFSIE